MRRCPSSSRRTWRPDRRASRTLLDRDRGPVSSNTTGKPTTTRLLGADAPAHRAVAAPCAYFSPLSLEATWRCHLRQEPDAVIPHGRIRGGGYEQSSSLLRLLGVCRFGLGTRSPNGPQAVQLIGNVVRKTTRRSGERGRPRRERCDRLLLYARGRQPCGPRRCRLHGDGRSSGEGQRGAPTSKIRRARPARRIRSAPRRQARSSRDRRPSPSRVAGGHRGRRALSVS
jgi:hypothetical protein